MLHRRLLSRQEQSDDGVRCAAWAGQLDEWGDKVPPTGMECNHGRWSVKKVGRCCVCSFDSYGLPVNLLLTSNDIDSLQVSKEAGKKVRGKGYS